MIRILLHGCCGHMGREVSATALADAGTEISRALVEDGRTADSCREALGTLRRAYLTQQLARHTHRAEEMMQEGKAAYIDELNQVKRIQDELTHENLYE